MTEDVKKELKAIAKRLKQITQGVAAANKTEDAHDTVFFFIGVAEPEEGGVQFTSRVGVGGNMDAAHTMFHKTHDQLF